MRDFLFAIAGTTLVILGIVYVLQDFVKIDVDKAANKYAKIICDNIKKGE